jgi:O-antigen/teichoic acid export membrane protein
MQRWLLCPRFSAFHKKMSTLSSVSRLISKPASRQLTSAGAVAQSVGTKGLILFTNAATGIITARTLQPAGRGELAAMILWPVFLASILTLGIPSAVTFQLRTHPKRRPEIIGTALFAALITSLLAMLVGFLFLRSWMAQYPPKTVLFAQLFLLSTPCTSLLLVGKAALESAGNFTLSNKLLACSPVLTLIGLLLFLAIRSLTPFTAALCYVVVGIVPIIWMSKNLWHHFQPRFDGLKNSFQLLISYGIRAYGIDLCGTMALYVDQALVVRSLDPSMMGVYVVALSLSRMLNAFHTSVVMVLFPKAVSQSASTVRELTSRAMRMSTLLTASAGAFIIALGPQVLALLYGNAYRNADTVLRILVVEVVLSGAALVLSQAFMALGRPGVITAVQVTGLLVTVPLMLVFIPRLGVAGAGLALLISTTLRLLLVIACFPIALKMPVPAVLPRMEDLVYMTRAASRMLAQITSQKLRTPAELQS